MFQQATIYKQNMEADKHGRKLSNAQTKSSASNPVEDTQWSSQSLILLVRLSRGWSAWVQAPFCKQRLVHRPRAGELEDTSLFWDNCALVFWW